MVVYTPTTNRNWQEYHFKYFKNYFEAVGTVTCSSVLCESLPCDEEFETYIDDSEYEKYPEY